MLRVSIRTKVPAELLRSDDNIRDSVRNLVGTSPMQFKDMMRLVNNHAGKIVGVDAAFRLELAFLNQRALPL